MSERNRAPMERRSEAVGSSGHSVSAVYRLVVSSLAFHSFRPQAWARGVSERRETTRRAAEWTTLAPPLSSLRRFLAHGVSLSSCLSLVTASLTPSSLRSRTAATSGRSFGRHSSHSVPLSSRVAPFGLPPAARNVKRRENCDMEIRLKDFQLCNH